MERRTVQLKVAGQTYRVVTSASADELAALTEAVDAKIAAVTPKGRAITPQSLLLAALALANELSEERARRDALERRTRDLLRRVIVRVDRALETEPAEGG